MYIVKISQFQGNGSFTYNLDNKYNQVVIFSDIEEAMYTVSSLFKGIKWDKNAPPLIGTAVTETGLITIDISPCSLSCKEKLSSLKEIK